MHARCAPWLQESPPGQGVGYCRLTPLSTSLTAKGSRVLGVGWRGILPGGEVGYVLFGSYCHSNPYPWVLLEHFYHRQD